MVFPFRKGYKPQFTDEIIEISAISTKISPNTSSKISTKRKLWEIFMKKSLEKFLIKGKSFFKLNFYRSVVMDSFTIELVSNASFNCFPNNSLISFTIFLPKQIHLKGEWEVAISEISYPSLYQNVTEGKFTFIDCREISEEKRKIVPMNIEPGLYPSIVDIVVAMNNKFRERLGAQVFEYNGIYVSVDKITQKHAVHLPESESVFIIQSADLSHILGCNLEQNQTGFIMKGKGPHYPQYSYDIIRIHSPLV